jgi:hypothetical protein
MQVTFGNTAYVAGCGESMLDSIERSSLSVTMTGEQMVATTYEALTEYVRETPEEERDDIWTFLNIARNNINTYKRRRSVGDIVFVA